MRKTGLFTVCAMVAAGAVSADQCQTPGQSFVSLPVQIAISDIQSKLNDMVAVEMSGRSNDPVPKPMINDVLTWTARRDVVRLRPLNTETLQLSTSVTGELRVKGTVQIIRGDVGKLLGKLNPTKFNVSQSARLSADAAVNTAPLLTSDWGVNPRASVASVRVTKAEATIAKIGNVSFRGQVQPEFQKLVNDAIAKLNQNLPRDDFLRTEVAKIWTDLHQVFMVESDIRGWVVVTPKEFVASQLLVDGENGSVHIVLGACLETFGVISNTEPGVPSVGPLPPLKLVDQVDDGRIEANLPVGARWSTLTALANTELERNSFQWPADNSEYNVSLSSVTLEGRDDGTVLATLNLSVATGFFQRVFLGRSFTGDLTFAVRPQLDDTRFSVNDVRVTSESSSLLQGLSWLAQGQLVALVEEKVRFDVGDVLSGSERAAADALKQLSVDLQSDGVQVSFGEPSLSLSLADPNETGLMINANGLVSVFAQVLEIAP